MRQASGHPYVNQNLYRSSGMVDAYGMADFGTRPAALTSELEHYTALQKLSGCTFPATTSQDPCASSRTAQSLQSTAGIQSVGSSAATYRMNATAPLYAMSSLSYTDWTNSNPALSGNIRPLISNNPTSLTSPTVPITKGKNRQSISPNFQSENPNAYRNLHPSTSFYLINVSF